MRLKVSPKEAIIRIDELVRLASQIKDVIIDDYYRREEEYEKEEGEEAKSKEKEAIKDPLERTVMSMAALAEVPYSYSFYPDEKIIDGYDSQFSKWYNEALSVLESVFQDFSPIYTFEQAWKKPPSTSVFGGRPFKDNVDCFEVKISVLVSFYSDLQGLVRSPLLYLNENAQIWFYDFVCQLKPDSNEAALCAFMFQFGIGEFKEFEDIYTYVTGEGRSDDFPKGWNTTIKSAYDGINRKSNVSFGFPILRKQKTMLALHFPSRLIGASF